MSVTNQPHGSMRRIVGRLLTVGGVLFYAFAALLLVTVIWFRKPSPVYFYGPPPLLGGDGGQAPPKEDILLVFEQVMARRDVDTLVDFYDPDAVFQDAFGRQVGREQIRKMYGEILGKVDAVKVEVQHFSAQGNVVVMTGLSHFDIQGVTIQLPTTFFLVFRNGKIWYQWDNFDAMRFFDDIPLLGPLLRAVRELPSA
jgi:ketosteroid isomerase-like protein